MIGGLFIGDRGHPYNPGRRNLLHLFLFESRWGSTSGLPCSDQRSLTKNAITPKFPSRRNPAPIIIVIIDV
jgi:hypothetical protein